MVCWDIPNPNWNPRAIDIANDGDSGFGDGLPNECDPNPNLLSAPSPQPCPSGNTGPDEDQDCFSNRQDNCPLVANDQTDADSDGIGDECDPNPSSPDGHRHVGCIFVPATVAVGGSGQMQTGSFVEDETCASADPTPTPIPTTLPVGGIAELPTVADTSSDARDSSADRKYLTPVAAAIAGATVTLAAGAWYARRRWPR